MRYNPALDGLRAVAVSLVIATHSYHAFMPGGWIGVDVFFVLSGYLITLILLSELRQAGKISFINFYTRRFLRLTPALAILVVFQVLRSAVSPDGATIREATFIGAAYIENWNNVFQFGPFDLMGHTWSLATEEQFYCVWPLALLFLAKHRPLILLGATLVGMSALRVISLKAGYSDLTLQYSPHIRPVGLVIGCILAMLPLDRLSPPKWGAAILLGVIILIGIAADMSAYLHLGAPLAASLATAGLIACLQPASATANLLSSTPLRYTGKISYGLYLYHWPLFILGEEWKIHLPFHMYAAGLIVGIYLCATLSYEFVEKPFLKLKNLFKPGQPIRDFAQGGRGYHELTPLARPLPTGYLSSRRLGSQ